ncbi:sodium:proton antiporter [Corynebacterium sp. MC-04]|uniref:Sodium:proton antiporter n=1 Tax=Corynebacterium parakroppenstedtii TaxID=2828363 RepID=A0ABS9HK28_9CORY|nr:MULTISPECIES: sodium:proton antiporter [Corynebacterium]KXB49317.1 putative Na+/H+ antiporter [Corynebacterium kroppenstedtii]MBY0788718.1 sodium:proton antiporter [Corynebacterium parakroppenstedtii]MBY0792780.1 sodium:proton antiporter [Corynebacterium parakroppenstedtii]MBY0796881.1 sodium:proton antiporter [Corynebacterium parakroppenstedtii]MCF6770136.1 sodium:proton antiporter [Corynebacterium parakroppenstedtii]
METLIVIVGLMFATVIVVSIGERTNLPWPVLLTLLTTATMVFPAIPDISLPPDLILPLFLPPLIWAMARRLSWPLIRSQWRTLLSLSVLLVVVTILAVAGTSMVLIPGLSVAGAIALGAAVAPSDPVAVEAVAEPAGIPRRVIGTLQTEGLFNDAVALVAFQLALNSLYNDDSIHVGPALLRFVYTTLASIALGWLIGHVAGRALEYTAGSNTVNALSWVVPFAVYIAAEEIHASGVIAVVVAAVEMTSRVSATAAEDRLTGSAFWETAELLVTGLAFGLIGLSVRNAVEQTSTRIGEGIVWGLVISGVLFAVRFVWMYDQYLLNKHGKKKNVSPLRLQEVLVLTWSGMRGLVTLALVLSVPAGYINVYNEMPLIAITVLFCTMVVPGLTLPWIMQKLNVNEGNDAIADATMDRLLRRAHNAAMDVLQSKGEDLPPEAIQAIARRFRDMTGVPKDDEPENYEDAVRRLREVRRKVTAVRLEAIEAAQVEVMSARFEPGADPFIIDEVLAQLDRMTLASGENSVMGLRER